MNIQEPAPDSLLRHRPFVLYWNARISTSIASQMIAVAVGWQMYTITGSALDLGLVGLAQFLPATVLVLVAGQAADRYDRRRILQLCQTVEGIAALALAYGSFTGHITKEFILIAVFFLGSGRAFEATTNQALLPAVVPAALLPRAIASSATTTQVATISGPAIGGFLYAVSPTFVYSVCAVLFLCSIIQIVFIHLERVVASTRPPLTLATVFAGLSYIRQNRILLGIITLDLFAVLLGGATGLLPIYAKDVFDVGPGGLGLLRSAPAVGALFFLIVMTRWPLTRNIGRIEFATVAVFGVAIIVFAVSRSFVLSMVALAVLGAADSISVVIRLTLLQIETPDDLRGRVSAVNSLFTSMSNQIGDFRAGLVASWLGAVPAVLAGGIGTLLVVVVMMRVFPELLAVKTFHDKRDKQG
jgi:MFS family permease